MKYIFLIAILFAGCAPNLPPMKQRHNPAHPFARHNASASLFKDYTPFQPVEAGDWRQLNRNVAPKVGG